MFRTVMCGVILLLSLTAMAEEKSPSEKAISEAISMMEARRDAIVDPLERARIDKAIRELEVLLEEPASKPLGGFAIDMELLKKKFAARPVYDPKSGELTLKYDFPGKAQLADFEYRDKQVSLTKKSLSIEADGEVKHLARFKSFSVSAVMTIRTMSGAAIGSTSGFSLMAAGDNHDAAILLPLNGAAPFKVVAPRLRSGSIPVQFRMSPEKITVRYGGETLSMPNPQSDAVHQLVLRGGNDGCMFSNLEIVGVPDPVWFKDFAKSE